LKYMRFVAKRESREQPFPDCCNKMLRKRCSNWG
jgi:hypothetical protein